MKMVAFSSSASLMLLPIAIVALSNISSPTALDPSANATEITSNMRRATSAEATSTSSSSTRTTTKTNATTTPGNKMKTIMLAVMQIMDLYQDVRQKHNLDDIRHVLHKPKGVNQRCYDDVVDFIDAFIGEKHNASDQEYITPAWALQMADAMGKPPAGLLRGTLQWVGNYDQCLDVHAKIPNGTYLGSRQTPRSRSSEFRTRYCRAQIWSLPSDMSMDGITDSDDWIKRSKPFIVNWGLCLPESCDSQDVTDLLTKETLPGFQLPVFDVVCFERDLDLGSDGGAVFAVCLLSFMGTVVLISTIVESAIYYGFIPLPQGWKAANDNKVTKDQPLKEENTARAGNGTEKTEMEPGIRNDKTPLSIDRRPKDVLGKEDIPPKPSNEHQVESKDQKSTLAMKLLEAFSLRCNGRKLMTTSKSSDPNVVTCIQGIRVISMGWIILGHSYIVLNYNHFSYMYTSAYDMEKTVSRLSFTFVPASNLSVDTFFVISGLLVMKMTLKELRRGKGRPVGFWVMFYLHRLWRLTPVYMMVLMTGTTLYDFLVEGPLKSRTYEMFDYCDTHWWSNLLYINNFYKSSEMCMIWSWYLAADMQLFWISPVFIVLIHRKYRVGLLVLVATILLGTLTTFLLTLDHPGIFTTAMLKLNVDYMKHVYLVPWARIAGFAIGMLVGVILEDAPDKLYFSKLKAFLIWVFLTCAAVFMIMIVHDKMDNLQGHTWDKGTMALYESTSRLVWSIYIGWIIYACQSGLGGIATDFLTWTGFHPLARLTYTVYLVHPMIITFYEYQRNSTIDLQDSVMIYIFCGNLILSYSIGALYSLVFEAPLLTLEKILLKKK